MRSRMLSFWMGTHESGSSLVVLEEEEVKLKSWIGANSRVLGGRVLERWGDDLPFLFKVLSVEKALSIQAHPDKELAKELNKMHPNLYKDPNHKPEMAIAITEFKALCGFVSTKDLKDVLSNVPEIKELVSLEDENLIMNIKEKDGHKEVKSVLQSVFTKLMSAGKETIAELVLKLKDRLNEESKVRMLNEKEELALLLEKQYPADIGVLSSFFFNYVKLNSGEALYIDANEPHAYVSGECIECMATSDNVVRAGLTPKYRDVQTLCSMLTYKQGFPEILQGIPINPYILRYTPPIDEFEVDHCLLPPGESLAFSSIPGPSLFVVMAGEGTIDNMVIGEGCVFFVPANNEIKVTADADKKLWMYRAGVNSKFFDQASWTRMTSSGISSSKRSTRECYCKHPAILGRSATTGNLGRQFWGCRNWKEKEKNCGYFRWDDELEDGLAYMKQHTEKDEMNYMEKVVDEDELKYALYSLVGFLSGLFVGIILGFLLAKL